MTTLKYHPATDETLQRVATALETMVENAELEWDADNERYTNRSVKAFIDSFADSDSYGVSIPMGSSTACTKLGANASIAAPTPGTIASPGTDPYASIPAFKTWNVNGYVDADGTPHVTAIEGDGNFRLDGSNGNVWVMAPVLYYAASVSGSNELLYVSKTRLQGMKPQPGALLPDGTQRPYMLYAKYAGGMYGSSYASVSGVPSVAYPETSVSHDALITLCKNATTGYAGKSYADDWYVKAMFLLKYATKHSQSVMAGCTSYHYTYACTVSESNVKRIIISATDAANLVVGSCVSLGTGTDKNVAATRSVHAKAKILKIEAYNSSNSAVYLDTTATFSTTAGTTNLFTLPWFTGATDQVEGDGSPYSNSNGKEPFKLQNIELAVGFTEVLGDVIVSSDGSSGWEICLNRDSRNEATSVTANYTRTGKYLYSDTTDSWKYPLYPDFTCDLPFGSGYGASDSSGMCDGSYTNKKATSGTREWRGLGALTLGADAGLFCVYANGGLSAADWYIGSRLSANGRKG
ncbi:MAG: hypothetical protein IJ111_01160 [Eggerthellaceae bacterium]|nr:hypothetical protein [Eggerthellaceae bacterium]